MILSTPYPQSYEAKVAFVKRFEASPSVKALTPPARRAAANARWEEARLESIVSVKTTDTEVLILD